MSAFLLSLAFWLPPQELMPPPRGSTVAEARAAIDRGVTFLKNKQNSDGSWGGAGEAIWTFTGDVWSTAETHHAWRVATTGLCTMALLESGQREAHRAAIDRAIDYLLANTDIRRPNEWDTMNSWAYIYSLQALAIAARDAHILENAPRLANLRVAAKELAGGLVSYQSLSGGWGYLELDPPVTQRLQWATSFTTAAALVAFADARDAGFEIDTTMVRRAVGAVRRCSLPTGAYTYSVQATADPRTMEWIDQIKGSLGRIQCCNVALHLNNLPITEEKIASGLDYFFRYHKFLDIARNRPIPHEAYYFNSGYFYLFGHYYAARAVGLLPVERRPTYFAKLRAEIIKLQQSDGSMYDYDMHAYHKPYGTAFGVLTLAESLRGAVGR